MTYFNPKIYNKDNLKDEDLRELEYWNEVFTNVIDNSFDDFCLKEMDDSETLRKIKTELIGNFCKMVKTNLAYAMQDNIVGIIDNYDEDVEEVENPTTFTNVREEDK